MVDIVDAATRSRMMAGIRGKNTGPEVSLRRAMHARGFRYRLHVRSLPGRPDLVFPRYKAVVLVHGCFWHRHEGCRYATSPATRPEFWTEKFATNMARDRSNEGRLLAAGWRIAVVWECALRRSIDEVAGQLSRWLQSQSHDRLEL
ncbi:DNA mismatch endonuclease Vsr [Sphingomonadales bacterium 56]|uniref:very short patch repair endonuclease n=1 Tax=unclassified Sphingobium TaxID=2611147 RepID=UPI00191A5797|nr:MULTISPECIES: very short patch repair endonuclease [unclassified Sphingobium]MBY2928925.1 DNA mismatch endonuclease Vsr [Sphingomonadales bacterium 56]MBY2959223.1 DNA mismatch endonuclease Vsr [Sphingomonadales bacterium 58]CAD7338265.1 Very short patch repair protein [Sphingobium sp. S6]CAD7338704.1 Very short patch repair protein [Sphingobium sp. S8]